MPMLICILKNYPSNLHGALHKMYVCTGQAIHVQYAPVHVQKYRMYVRHVQYSQTMLCVQHFHLFFISLQF
jgi:hypothetical protein